jgi:hypothetical protein
MVFDLGFRHCLKTSPKVTKEFIYAFYNLGWRHFATQDVNGNEVDWSGAWSLDALIEAK